MGIPDYVLDENYSNVELYNIISYSYQNPY